MTLDSKSFNHPKMATLQLPHLLLHFTLLTLFSINDIILAQVLPASENFTFVNEGEFGDRIIEYDASYRVIRNDNFRFINEPFRLCFYNTTPGAYIFAIRAGFPGDESLMRWVWDANRDHPAGENSTLNFRPDGNLVIAEADGRVVWQTNTANKGVTELELLSNGNLVLRDKNGKFIWQSFDHPRDTLLNGQSLKINGPNRLVSRKSDMDPSDGPYSMLLDHRGFIMYVNQTRKPLIYGGWQDKNFGDLVTFKVVPHNDNKTAYELVLDTNPIPTPASSPGNNRKLLQVRPIGGGGKLFLNKLNYNATSSFLRLGSDGNLRAFTYYDPVEFLKWEESFAFFSSFFVRECGLPSKCGSFGLCDKSMCVACPSPKGLFGWSESCSPPKLPGCGKSGKNTKVDYYKIVGVEHFLGPYLDGGKAMKLSECRARCDKDCRCLGFFYKEKASKCLLAPLLGTLIKDENTSVGYIKYTL